MHTRNNALSKPKTIGRWNNSNVRVCLVFTLFFSKAQTLRLQYIVHCVFAFSWKWNWITSKMHAYMTSLSGKTKQDLLHTEANALIRAESESVKDADEISINLDSVNTEATPSLIFCSFCFVLAILLVARKSSS